MIAPKSARKEIIFGQEVLQVIGEICVYLAITPNIFCVGQFVILNTWLFLQHYYFRSHQGTFLARFFKVTSAFFKTTSFLRFEQ